MTEDDKKLLLTDLCARLPYGVKVYGNYSYSDGEKIVDDKRVEILDLSKLDWLFNGIEIKPYLRPMSSMTEKERDEYTDIKKGECNGCVLTGKGDPDTEFLLVDWLNEHYFDYRSLISMGLALEAPKNMYKIWQQ